MVLKQVASSLSLSHSLPLCVCCQYIATVVMYIDKYFDVTSIVCNVKNIESYVDLMNNVLFLSINKHYECFNKSKPIEHKYNRIKTNEHEYQTFV